MHYKEVKACYKKRMAEKKKAVQAIVDAAGSSPTQSAAPSLKRPLDQFDDGDASSKRISTENERVLQGELPVVVFDGQDSPSAKMSLWEKTFPIFDMVERCLRNESDQKSVQGGDPSIFFMQMSTYGARIALIAREMEAAHTDSVRMQKEEMTRIRGKCTEMNSMYLKQKSDYESKTAEMEELLKSHDILFEKLQSKEKEFKQAIQQVEKLKGDLSEDIVGAFENAIAQVKLLHPGIDLTGIDTFKIVKGGAIVDEGEEITAD